MDARSTKFVWHDLMTTDVDSAKRFYGELLGWKFERGKDGGYEHIKAGEAMIGGMMKFEKPGIPSHWLGYIGVDDVDSTVGAIQRNGGKVMNPAMDIPNVGRFAVTADPHGAIFAPFRDAGQHGPSPEIDDKPPMSTFCWDELMSPDPKASAKFYNTVFGWGIETTEMPGFGTYTLLKRTGAKDKTGAVRNAGGIAPMQPGAQHPPFWLTYVAVQNADASAEKVKKLGGKVMMPPMKIANVGTFFIAMDPQNATIAFLAP